MPDNAKGSGEELGGLGDNLTDDLDHWLEEFDRVTSSAPKPAPANLAVKPAIGSAPAGPAAAAPRAPGDVVDIDDKDLASFGGEGEALGDLLGAPPPLPPVEEGPDDSVLTSAPRPASSRRPAQPAATVKPVAPKPAAAPATPPTAAKGFGRQAAPSESVKEADSPYSAADASFEEEPIGADDEFADSTRVVSMDERLLARASQPAPMPAPIKPARRGPAVVRREDLAAIREKRQAEAARAVEAGEARAVEERRLKQSLSFEEPTPPPAAPPEEDFYDAVEVSDSATTTPAPATPAPPAEAAAPARTETARRVSANIVRRPSQTVQADVLKQVREAGQGLSGKSKPAVHEAASPGIDADAVIADAAPFSEQEVVPPDDVDDGPSATIEAEPPPEVEIEALAYDEAVGFLAEESAPSAADASGTPAPEAAASELAPETLAPEAGASALAPETLAPEEAAAAVADDDGPVTLEVDEPAPAAVDAAAEGAEAAAGGEDEARPTLAVGEADDEDGEGPPTVGEAAEDELGAPAAFEVEEAVAAPAEADDEGPEAPAGMAATQGLEVLDPEEAFAAETLGPDEDGEASGDGQELPETGIFMAPAAAVARASDELSGARADEDAVPGTKAHTPVPPILRVATPLPADFVAEMVNQSSATEESPDNVAAYQPVDFRLDPATFKFPEEAPPESSKADAEALLARYERELASTSEPLALARLHLEAGRAAELVDDPAKAREHYEEACQADPKLATAPRALRRLLMRLGDHREALAQLEAEAQLASPSDREALQAYRADLLVAIGEQDVARMVYGELADANPDDVRTALAEIELAYADERDDELLVALARAARLVKDPNLAGAFTTLRGRFLERAGREADARAAYQAALELDAADRGARFGLLRLSLRAKAPADAAKTATVLVDPSVEPGLGSAVARRSAVAWLRAGDVTSAAEALETARSAAPADPLLLGTLADAGAASGKAMDAVKTLETWAEVEPSPALRAEALRRAAALARAAEGPAALVAALETAVSVDPDDPLGAAELEAAYLAAGDVDAAVARLHAAADADPEAAAGTCVHAAELLLAAGRRDEAIAELERAGKAAPDSGIVAELLGHQLALAGRRAALAELLARRVGSAEEPRDPTSARLRAARAAELAAREATGDAGEPASLLAAEAAWGALLDEAPDLQVAHLALVALAERRGDRQALLAALAKAQDSARDPARAVGFALRRASLLADPAAAEPDPAAGEAALAQALAFDRSDPRATALVVSLAAAAGRWGDAASRLVERAEALPDGPERQAVTYRAASILAEREGDVERAAALVAPVVTARPGFAGAGVLLEDAYRRQGDFAALAARRMALGEPVPGVQAESPAMRFARLMSLGELHELHLGDPSRAVELYQRALEVRPAEPIVREALARAAVVGGDVAPLSALAVAELARSEDADDRAGRVAAYEELAWIDGDLRNDMTGAAASFESLAALEPGHFAALRALERQTAGEGRTGDLLGIWQRIEAIMTAPIDTASLALTRAELADVLGRHDEAIAAWRKAWQTLAGAADGAEALAGTAADAPAGPAIDAPAATATDDPAAMATDGPAARPAAAVPATSALLRAPLFRLEGRARQGAPDAGLATLQDAVARYFDGDGRSEAVFLTRAGETLADLGRADEAIARFRAAVVASPGHRPALRAWVRVALATERYPDVVEAAEQEAEAAGGDAATVHLYHLAGVAAMDKLGEPERAVADLRRVLELEPGHDDAFLRLRSLLGERGRYEDLAQLLSARVELETDTAALVELHRSLAAICRDELHDSERAVASLKALLSRQPNDAAALTALGDLAWERGEWSDAAQTLIRRAKIERDELARKEVFFRLGVIYADADKLPDNRWALEAFQRVLKTDPNDVRALDYLSRLGAEGGNWRLALAAAEKLVSVETDPGARIRQLHRIGKIHEEGLKDRVRAEDAYRRALDLDATDADALQALVDFYRRGNDLRSVRVHLDRVAGHMRQRLVRDPFDQVAHQVLARALAARAGAGAAGSIEAARCASELAVACGCDDEDARSLAAEAMKGGVSARGLGSAEVDDALVHPSIPNGLRQVFRLLGETLGKRMPPDLRVHGVGRGERLPRSGHPVRDVVQTVAAEMGIADFDVYVSSSQPTALGVELTEPPSVILGSRLAVADHPLRIRFAAGRAFELVLAHMAVPARLREEELGVLLAGILRQYDPSFAPPGLPQGAIAEEQQRMSRLIPKRLRDEVFPFAAEISGLSFDHAAYWRGVQHTGNRAGLIAAGSALAGVEVLLMTGEHPDLQAARGDAAIQELMRFATSDEHCDVRRMLAQAGG